MSIYFAEKPEYFEFISTLEEERDEYRELHEKYAKITRKNQTELMATRSKVTFSMNVIKPPERSRPSRSQPVSALAKIKRNSNNIPKKTTKGSIQPLIMPRQVLSTSLPSRANNAKRIFEPQRLKNLQKEEKNEPLLIGKSLAKEILAARHASDIFSETI